MQMLYGVAIGNALAAFRKGEASADELVTLRDQTKAIVDTQGNLVAALAELDAAMAQSGAGAGAAVPLAPERFVAQIDGIVLSNELREEISQALQKAVMVEIAKIDTGGDMVATPLSRITSFGAGIGSQTAGFAIVARNRIQGTGTE
jgi:hypothetical protein